MGIGIDDILDKVSETLSNEEFGFVESEFLYGEFGKTPESLVHRAFALFVTDGADNDGRRRLSERYSKANLHVTFASELRPTSKRSDLRRAYRLFTEAEWVLDALEDNDFQIFADRRTYRFGGNNAFLLTDIVYQVRFQPYTPENSP